MKNPSEYSEGFFFWLIREHLHGSEFCLDSRLYLEPITEEYIALLCKDREDELIIVLETIREVFECHNGVLYLFTEECLLEEVVELYLIQFSDDEYINDIIGILIAEIQDTLRKSYEIKCFSSFEEVFDRNHNIICLQEHLTKIIVYEAIMIHLIIFFLILFIWLQYAECLEIHELTTYGIDLLINITTQFTDKKPCIRTGNNILNYEFFEKFDAWTRTKEFDEIQNRVGKVT